MNHTLFSRGKFNECTKVFNTHYFTGENLTFFKISCNNFDIVECFIHHFFFCTTYRNCTCLININFYACFINNCIDCFSTLSDYITDFIRVNLNLNNFRCIFAYFFSRLCNTFFHYFCQNVFSCFFCFCNCFFNNRSCQSMNLNIHLNCSDTIMSTRYLKVHISEEIFQTLNIC